MISPVGNDPLPRSQAQQSDELTAILQGHTSDERLSGSAYWSAAVTPGGRLRRHRRALIGPWKRRSAGAWGPRN